MKLLIRKGRIIDPSQGIDEIGDILVEDGVITRVESHISATGPTCNVLDAMGLVVSPGFVDLHCHLRQPGFEEKETIATGTRAAAHGGFTTVCCMPNTEPPIATPAVVEQVRSIAGQVATVDVLPIAAVTEGRLGKQPADLVALARAGAIAFSDDGSPVPDSHVMYRALEESRILGLPVVDHCEDPSLSIGGLMNEGPLAEKLGYKGIPCEAEERMVARDIRLAKATGGRIHIAHVSTAGSVNLIRKAKSEGVRITAEVTPHHLTLTEEAVLTHGTNAKVNPPLRTTKDSDALIQGLADGTIDAIATDHAPHTKADKEKGFEYADFGISGLETALGTLMILVHRGDIDLRTLISKLTWEPAQIIGSGRGTLNVKSRADITIFDPDAEWTVDPEKLYSKGKNTPFTGVTLKGKTIATFVGGRPVYNCSNPA